MKESSANSNNRRTAIIDYFAFCGVFPFGAPGRFPLVKLAAELSDMNISMAYVSSLESFFKKDIVAANAAFLKKCRKANFKHLVPVPVIDLSMPDFEAETDHYVETYNIRAVRIAPNYHGYQLDAEVCERLVRVLDAKNLLLLAAREIDDLRFQAPCLGVKPLTLAALEPLFQAGLKSNAVLNNFSIGEIQDRMSVVPSNFHFDSAAFDKAFPTLEKFVEKHGADRLVYGSQTPFLYAGAVMHNLQMSALPVSAATNILTGVKSR